MSNSLLIEIVGRDGSEWTISGPGFGRQGVTLKPRVSQLIDAPVKTLFVPGPFGEEFAGKRVQRREMVFTVQIGGDDMDVDDWAYADAAWRWAWDYEQESMMRVTVLNSSGAVVSSRYIMLRLLEEPKSYGDRDPYITGDNEVVMTVTATFPYWRSDDLIQEWTTGSASGSHTFTVASDSDVPVWMRWAVTAPGVWTLSDKSWGSEVYARGDADENRTVELPELPSGAHASVDSDPRAQTIICVNGFPAQHHWRGRDLLYPLQPGVEGTVTASVTGATGGAAVALIVPRWYSRPWSGPVAL